MSFFHWHRFYEILFIKEGNYKLTNNQKIIEADRPGIFIHKPFSLHNMNSFGEVYHRRLLYVSREIINQFTLQMVDPKLFNNANLIYGWPDGDELADWIRIFHWLPAIRMTGSPLPSSVPCSSAGLCRSPTTAEGKSSAVPIPISRMC